MKNEQDVSRRNFLQRLSLMGLAGVGGSTLLSACGGGDGNGGQESGTEGAQSQANGLPTTEADCSDLSALTAQQKKQRSQMVESLNYIEETEKPDQYCSNCALYQQPAQEETTDNECGGCQLFPGPVYPEGWCSSWTPAS